MISAGFYDWMDYLIAVKFVFAYLKIKKGQFGYMTEDDAFLDIKANAQAGRFTGLKKLVQFIDSVRTDCKCILLEHHMPLLRIFLKEKSVCVWKNDAKCRLFGDRRAH